MTREEKQRRIQVFCDKIICGEKCPLWETEECCTSLDVVDRNYDMLVEAGRIIPPNTPTETPTNDPVDHPSHYTQGRIECIEAMIESQGKEAVKHFCICNAFKYIWRAEHKNKLEDINKAMWYLNKYKELSEDGTT